MKKKAKKAAPKKPKKAPGKLKKLVKKVVKLSKSVAKPAPAAAKAKGKVESKPEKAPKGKLGKKAEAMAQLAKQVQEPEPEVILTNAEGKQYCRVHDCDNAATTTGYCRLHYLALWKRNRIKAKILQGGKLDKYIEDLTQKYPDKYLEMLRKDLSSEKDFNVIVSEMDVEDSGDEIEQEEEANRFIEEVRGGIPTGSDDDEGGY